ncbi:sugar ABC transporter permease [Anoxybacterium hadale]|uniref:Sugar ABC transporter permease n=1 Tax=Anoxybacterium hadale TaxID=3408580 RepID=A0ACD1AAR5_9FIRM|nr:sugar ABC transporter permease [Clostridiales bacterium]
MNETKRKKYDTGLLFLLVSFGGVLLFYLWPFMVSLWFAFTDSPARGNFAGIDNFTGLFHNKAYLLGLKNTIAFIGMSVPLGMLLSLLVAILILRNGRRKELFVLLFLIPLVIPSGSTIFFWKALFLDDGYLNGILISLGFGRVRWLETSAVRYVFLLIFVWKNLGYNMVLFLAGLHNIPREQYEAASVDGSGPVTTFLQITLPGLSPTLVLTAIMSVINSFKVFKEIYLITGNYPHESIYMLQHFMNNMFYSLNYQKLSAATCILVMTITMAVLLLLRLERGGEE